MSGTGGLPLTLADVEAAYARIRNGVLRTPCVHSPALSAELGCELWIKFENLQETGSFKERGALNRLLALSEEERRRGVIAASAGNHAQGVARHAARLGIPAIIVMPEEAPFTKVDRTERLGARVILHGHGVEEAAAEARRLAAEHGYTFVHPYDDPLVVAGQGTVALEMLEQAPQLEMLVVPVGGGGLISGIAVAAKGLRPEIRVFGVEAALYPSVRQALSGEPAVPGGPTIADGIAVKQPAPLTLAVIRALVEDVLLAEEADIEAAVVRLLEMEKTVAEGAGAAPLAAIAAHRGPFAGRRVGMVLSGGNIDSRVLSSVILRGLVRTERLVRYRVSVPDTPGALAAVAAVVARERGNIVDVVHQRAFSRLSVRQTDIDLTIETRNAEHALAIARALVAAGHHVRRLEPDGVSEVEIGK